MREKITNDREYEDMNLLSTAIKKDGWLQSSTILVNCMPEYSSRLTHSLNHSLSTENGNELFEVIDLYLPYPSYNQVWNPLTKKYEGYDFYLKNWVNDNISPTESYLFVDVIANDKPLTKAKSVVKSKLEGGTLRFASLYTIEGSILVPDFYIKQYNKRPQFHWENILNKNYE